MARKNNSTRSRLLDRSARSERRTRRQERSEPVPAADAPAPTMSVGGLQIPGIEMGNVEQTVRSVVGYVQENPVAAMAVALGAGVMLTSMYWDGQQGKRRGSR